MTDILYIHPFSQLSRSEIIPMGTIGLMNSLIGYHKIGKMYYEVNDSDILKTKIIAMDIHWYYAMHPAMQLASHCKKLNPSIKIIVGGYTATIFAEFILENMEVDYVIKGDAELPFFLLVQAIINGGDVSKIPNVCSREQKNNKIQYSISQTDFDKLDNISIEWFPSFKKKVVYYQSINFPAFVYPWIPIHRGCKYNCESCLGSNIYQYELTGRYLVARSPERVVEDFICLSDNPQIRMAYIFTDFIDVLGEEYTKIVFSRRYNLSLAYEFYNLPELSILERFTECFPESILIFTTMQNHTEIPRYFDLPKLEKAFKFLKRRNCRIRLLVTLNSLRKIKDRTYINNILYLRQKYSFDIYPFEDLFPPVPKPDTDRGKLFIQYRYFFEKGSKEKMFNFIRRHMLMFVTKCAPIMLQLIENLQTRYTIFLFQFHSLIGKIIAIFKHK